MNNDPITDEDKFRSHRFMREIARGNIPHETKHLAAMRTQRDVALDMCGKMITQNEELLKLRDEAIRERDEARREACEYGTLTPSAMYALAKSRGWDCFKETTP